MAELSLVAKATVVLATALLAAHLHRRARASVRALLLASAFGILLILPAAGLLIPERTIEIPVSYAGTFPLVLERVGADAAAIVATASPADDAVGRWRVPPVASVLRAVWALGAVSLLLRLCAALWRLRAMRRAGRPWREGTACVTAIGTDSGLTRRVDLFLHEALPAPMTFGVAHPSIGLPMDAPGWTRGALRQALVHELEHVRRGDWIVHLVAHVACALYWFHPLAWTAARHLCLESERACDDAVLRGTEHGAYAEQLVALARRMSKRSPVAVLSMAGRSDLSVRVHAVLDSRQARGPAGRLWTLSIVSVAIALVLAISPLKADRDAPQPQGGATPAGAAPTFEVTSIKRNNSATPGQTIRQLGNTFLARNVTLTDLIATAYRIQTAEQLSGESGWMTSERYDVEAKPAAVTPFADQMVMLQNLLADRFKLVLRRESRPAPMFALTRGATLRLKPATECPPGPDCSGFNTRPGEILGRRVTMARVAAILSGPRSGRRVVDDTEIDGAFDIELRWTPAPGQLPSGPAPDDAPPIDPTGPSLFTALEEQLGLRLVPTNGTLDHFVIERAEQPSEN